MASKVQIIAVDEEDAGQRLDNFLMRLLRKAPKSLIYRIIRKGEVRINKGRAKPDTRICAGDQVRVPPVKVPDKPLLADQEIPQAQLQLIEKNILFEDKDLMVINKPSGVAVHGGGGVNYGLIEVLRVLRPHAKRLELVHRIDRDTSGCLLVAKKASVLKALHAQIRANEFDKRYLAIVLGAWPKALKKVDLPLKKEHLSDGGWRVKVSQSGKQAVSFFNIKYALKEATVVAVTLKTGRTHQIRVHALAQGCPLLGDDRYGDRTANKKYRPMGMKRLALHAQFLGFTHPVSGQKVVFEAPLWPDFKKVMQALDATGTN